MKDRLVILQVSTLMLLAIGIVFQLVSTARIDKKVDAIYTSMPANNAQDIDNRLEAIQQSLDSIDSNLVNLH